MILCESIYGVKLVTKVESTQMSTGIGDDDNKV